MKSKITCYLNLLPNNGNRVEEAEDEKPLSVRQGRIEGEGAGGAHPPPLLEMTRGFLIQLVFCKKNYVVYWC